jgi:CheY-like chemotaxis protein
VGRRTRPLDSSPDYGALLQKYRALCRKHRALVDRYGTDMSEEHGALALAFAAIRRSHTGMALLCGGGFLVRNARWLALERRGEDGWQGDVRAYPNLRSLAVGEAGEMARAGERGRELRFSRQGNSEVIELRLERLDRPGRPLYLGLVRDVTEAVRAERRQERARSDAAERDRVRVMGELASATAHQMNNVLHAMALRVASLRGAGDEAEREASLAALARMVTEAAACVSRLQDVAGCSRGDAGSSPEPVRREEPALPRLRVLVVDDDPDVLEAAGLALSHLGEDVELTPSGADAVARFVAGERFDLVLCDIGMPQLDGWQVAREVHSLAPGTRLYLVSGWAREIPADEVRRAGAAGLLPKPLSLDALRALLAEGSGTASARPAALGEGAGAPGHAVERTHAS